MDENTSHTTAPRSPYAATAVLVALCVASTIAGQDAVERFTGFAINLNGGPRTASVDFNVERWSTDAEREQLLSILAEEPDARKANARLLAALQRMPKVGYMRTANSLGWDLRYARQSPLPDGGRRIVVATDRPIGFREARNQPRSIDYPFTLIEVQLDATDRGSGKILGGTRLLVDDNRNLVLENFAQQPVRFNEVRKVK